MKRSAAILLITASAVAFAGCGSGEDGTTSGKDSAGNGAEGNAAEEVSSESTQAAEGAGGDALADGMLTVWTTWSLILWFLPLEVRSTWRSRG